MSSTRLKIDPTDIARETAAARKLIAEAQLPRALSEVDPGAFGTTPLNLEMLDAVALAWATALALMRRPQSADIPAPILAFLVAEESTHRLAYLGDPPRFRGDPAGLPLEQYRDFDSATHESLLPMFLRDCVHFLQFYRNHPDGARQVKRDRESFECLLSYFQLISHTMKKRRPDAHMLCVDTPRLRFDGYRVSPIGVGESHALLPVTFDDIVGNDDFVKAGWRLARDVAGFDMKAGQNPKKIRNQILFALGSPGCGKTVTAHAICREFLKLCDSHAVPAVVRIIRRTDWASSYQNHSAGRLLEIFQDEVFNAPGVCAAYWADIDTAFAARGDADIRQEEKANLGTLFGILDGTIGPKNGRWFLLCDANTLHMDQAMISRISQNPLRAHGPATAEHFVRLLRDIKLRGRQRWLPAGDAEWRAIGDRCVSEKISGRDAEHLAGRILSYMEDFEEPAEYFSMSFEEKQKAIERLARPVTADLILTLLTDYCRFDRETRRQAEEDRFVSRVREIRFHLSAQRAAASLDEPKPA